MSLSTDTLISGLNTILLNCAECKMNFFFSLYRDSKWMNKQ